MTAASNSEARKRQAEVTDRSMAGVELSIEEIDEITGDDVAYWLSNDFMSPDMLAEKVRSWISAVVAARLAPVEAERDAARTARDERWALNKQARVEVAKLTEDRAGASREVHRLNALLDAAETRAAKYEALVEAVRASASHPHMGPDDTDASMLRAAAKRLRGGYEPGGSHTKQTVANVITAVADLIDGGAS